MKKKLVHKNTKIKDKKYKFNLSHAILTVFFIIIIVYLLRSIVLYINSPQIPTVTVQFSNVEQSNDFYGVVTRKETVYQSNADGVINFNHIENEKIIKSDIVAQISDKDTIDKAEYDLHDLKNSLLELQNIRGEDMILYSAEVRHENEAIKNSIDSFSFVSLSNSFTNINILKRNLDHMIEVRNRKLLTENSNSTRNLVNKINQTENIINSSISYVRISEPGILSFSFDGLENVFNFDSLYDITLEQINMVSKIKSIGNNSEVQIGDDIFKIVESNEWYITSYIDTELISDWTSNSYTTIFVENNFEYLPLEVFITRIDSGESQSRVTFRATRSLLNYITDRTVKFKIFDSSYEGFKIPVNSVVNRTYIKVPLKYVNEVNKSVMVKSNGLIIVTPLEISFSDETFVYIRQEFKSLKLGDVLILDDDNSDEYQLSETIQEKGVYISNFGYASFERIVIDDNTKIVDGYYILDAKLNNKLNIHDYIVADARNIDENQIVYVGR